MRAVAKRFGISKSTAARWRQRAGKRALRGDLLADRSRRPQRTTRTRQSLERLILDTRLELREQSALGEFGAQAIHRTLQARGVCDLPCSRTIGRILERCGALDGRRRRRHPPPPSGWYLPKVCAGRAELDSFDLIEDLCIERGPRIDVLTAISLHGHLVQAWPIEAQVTAKITLQRLLEHWRTDALPQYAQFDNDTRFQGAHHHRDSISRVVRLCLQLRITPVFTPPRETGFQARIEMFNRRWQEVVWERFHHANLARVLAQSRRFIEAYRTRHAMAGDASPLRRPFPARFELDLQRPPQGNIVYLRRTDSHGRVQLLGREFAVDRRWPHRLVRSEVDLDRHRITFFALRRRDPTRQPLLRSVKYKLPQRSFRE